MTGRTVPRRLAVSLPRRVTASPWATLAVAAWVALVVVQISSSGVADPLSLVVVIVVLLAVSTWGFTAAGTSPATAATALVVCAAVGFTAEYVGTRTGFPFGDYGYTGTLVPHAGGVPLVVPLAWFAMGVPAYAVGSIAVESMAVRSIAVESMAVGSRAVAPAVRVARWAVGAVALTAWDLFLDPQMTALGYWTWPHGGGYFGIPWSNYLGWFVVSAFVMALLDVVLGRRASGGPYRGLLGLYTSMAVVETIGFLGPLQWRPAVALAGAVGMGVPAAAAWWRLSRSADRV